MNISDYGYGVRLDNLNVDDPQKIRNFIENHCSIDFQNHVLPCNDDVETMLEYAGECGEWSGSGLAEMLSDAMENEHNIRMEPIVGNLADEYCLYQPGFPWDKRYEQDFGLSEKKLEELLKSYLSELTDSSPVFDYYDVPQTI